MKSSTDFKSTLAPYMTGLIQEKRSMGYSYKTQEYILGRFDAYCPAKANTAAIRLANEYRLLFRFYCCCGLRNSEAASLTPGNV